MSVLKTALHVRSVPRPAPLHGINPPVTRNTDAHSGEGMSTPARTGLLGLAERLDERRRALRSGDPEATAKQHRRGRLTVHERLELLFDPGSFHEVEAFRRHRAVAFDLDRHRPDSDGVVTGWGLINGQRVCVFAHDFRIFGGALGEAHAEKIHKIMDLALETGCPLVSLNDGAGARIQEGVVALAGYGGIFRRHVAAAGRIPQISVMLGPCAGGAAYAPALTDFVFAVRGISQMFVTGPDVVREVTGEGVVMDDLGGADIHATVSGVVTHCYSDEESCLEDVRYLLSILPAQNGLRPHFSTDDPPDRRTPALLDIVPSDGAKAYDMHDVIAQIVDHGEFFPVHDGWGRNIVCALALLDGQTVGIVANQPSVLAGAIDITASEKGAAFVDLCNRFAIPIVTLVDVPGFLPGVEQERCGIIRSGARLLSAYCRATVPRVQVILRKAYGGAYIVMDSRSIGADLSFAWPSNEVAVMGADAASRVVFRREIAASSDPEETRDRLRDRYRSELMHPWYAAERGLVDDVIDPVDTRRVLTEALAFLSGKANC